MIRRHLREWLLVGLISLGCLPSGSFADPPAVKADDSETAAVVAKVVDAVGGKEKLLALFRIKEMLVLNPDGKRPASPRNSVLEPPNHWWMGKKDRVKDEKEPAIFLVHAWTLRALTDPAAGLKLLPDLTDEDKPCFGVQVSGVVEPPMDLYFSTADAHLVRIDWRTDIHRFSEWKEHDGAKYPSRTIGYKKQSGKAWYQSDIVELERLAEVPAEYAK
jgi:hypothetical protein